MQTIMPRIKTQTVAIVLGLLMPGGASAQQDSEPRDPGQDAKPTTALPGQPHDTTPGRLGRQGGFDSELAYVRASEARVAELLDRASHAADELTAATLRLAAANLLLAEQLDAPCSLKLLRTLGLPDQEATGDVVDVLKHARALLDEVGQRIDKKMEQVADMDEDLAGSWAALQSNQTSLNAFLGALHVFLLPQEHDNVARALRRAASGLAPLLERAEPDIVAAAALWYAMLRAGEKSKRSALSVLDPVLKGRPTAGTNFAFYGRLLRCRLIADRSSPPTALALLLQLEDMLGDWFEEDESQGQAARSLLLLRAHILQVWKERLSSDAGTEERQFFDQRLEGIHAILKTPDARFLRLGHAIPVLVPIPQ